MATISNGIIKAEINTSRGQLVSLIHDGQEYFHNGGRDDYDGSGWGNSEIVPFPNFGPADNYKISLNGIDYCVEQHGISRYLPFDCSVEGNIAVLTQGYDGRSVPNPKYKPENGHPEFLNWASYTLRKKFVLAGKSLTANFEITNDSDKEMRYMLGWHPAFSTLGDAKKGIFTVLGGTITFEQVAKASQKLPEEALTANGRIVMYKNEETGRELVVSSNNFTNAVMLWTPGMDSGMFSVEHTTQLPVYRNQDYFRLGTFETLAPGQKKTYSVTVEILR